MFKTGSRVVHHNGEEGTIVAHDDCEVVAKFSDLKRDQYVWVKFDDGSINGWINGFYLKPIPTPQEKVEAARKALAEAEAELAASLLPKVGDRYFSELDKTTATVKAIVDDVVYYEYITSRGSKNYNGRIFESFLKSYETKLCDL